MKYLLRSLALLSLLTLSQSLYAQFLKTKNGQIVDQAGENVLLRGMGLGGWMLQEGYMLKVPGEGQQFVIRQRIAELIGEEKTKEFYNNWLNNHTTEADIKAMKSWGFNSVRLPMHYNLYTLPIEKEPVKGQDTWLTRGFAMTDSLLTWCKRNNMYLILDLHAAPGGQGNDNNISDRDPKRAALWESEENQRKMIALWRKLAEKYADEPYVAAYDIINEPNWGFTDLKNDPNGLQEKLNAPLRKLLIAVTEEIRKVDKNHIIIIEGNGWGNNYNGLFPLWDDNMVLSFHKYWNFNDAGSVAHFLNLRKEQNVPIWLGETGENSNVWFTEAIQLVESNNIGWCWWPLKKLGYNNPLEVKSPEGYEKVLAFWAGKQPKPTPAEASDAFMQLAENAKFENCIVHPDVIDAMFRQPGTNETLPFKRNVLDKKLTIKATDYDLGKNRYAYFDMDTANYFISTGGDRQQWNSGNTYRNDGVDIARRGNEYYVTDIKKGEWLQFTIQSSNTGNYNLQLSLTGAEPGSVKLSVNDHKKLISASTEQSDLVRFQNLKLSKGTNTIRLHFMGSGFDLHDLTFSKSL